jgi:hypothetical protein
MSTIFGIHQKKRYKRWIGVLLGRSGMHFSANYAVTYIVDNVIKCREVWMLWLTKGNLPRCGADAVLQACANGSPCLSSKSSL